MNINQTIGAKPRRDMARITVSLLNDLLATPLDGVDDATNRALRVLGDAAGFDRTYIFQFRNEALLDNTHEWVAAGVSPMIDRLQGVPASVLGPWLETLQGNTCVEVEDVTHLDPMHPAREILLQKGVVSLVLLPMLQDENLHGFLGYDDVHAPRRLSHDETFLLRCASNGIAALLARRRAADDRAHRTAQLQKALADKSRAEARLQDATAVSRSWAWEQDADLRFTYVSDSFRQLTGLDPAQTLGRTREDLLAEDPHCRASADWETLTARLKARKPFSGFVYRAFSPTGRDEALWVQIGGRPIFDAEGNFAGYRGAGTDVTALRRSLDRAEAGSRAKSAFLTTMSHEIRTPLNGIIGATELMQGVVETPHAIEWLGTIRESGETLMAMLDDVLDLSSLEAGTLTLEDEELEPAEILRRLEPIYEMRAKDRGLDFTVRIAAACSGPRRGDSTRVLQVLHHLLGNALKFTPSGAISLELSVADSNLLRFTVADTGIGMSREQLDRVLLPFEQGLGGITRPQSGRGLGLSIVHSLTLLMGGEVSIQTAPGAGTRVTLDLPLPQTGNETSTMRLADQTFNACPLPRKDWAELSVLVVDDNAINRLILKSMLEAMGIQADLASDGREGLGLWKIRRHDLVLMDIAMPVMDGMTTLAAIQASAEHGGHPCPVAIAVTANALRAQMDEYRAAGFDHYLSKPVRQRELESAIAAYWPQVR